MSIKIILNYDESTGTLTDKHGNIVGSWPRLDIEEPPLEDLLPTIPTLSVGDLVTLKSAGFTTADIVELILKGVVL